MDNSNFRYCMSFPKNTTEKILPIGGWINNKRVLFGNRELMTSHYIEGMPTKTKETEFTSNGQEAVYLSISGNLSAMLRLSLRLLTF